ncbi:MAG: hypothetical protein D6723_11115, partial [Acidobacteria bacterium]
MGIDRVTLYNK